MPRRLVTSPSYGERMTGDVAWTTEYLPSDLETVAIERIIVYIDPRSSCILSLEVIYNDGTMRRSPHGGSTLPEGTHVILRGPNERIIKVEGNNEGIVLNSLKFVSNNGTTYGPYGCTRVSPNFTLEAPHEGFGLLWLNGYSSHHVSILQATFATFGDVPEAIDSLKLEAGSRSRFLRQLLSPIVTLLVGTPAESLTVHEDVIRKLPIFIAALQGESLGARSKTINMPDENAAIIAALIEFLSTGEYTYAYGEQEDSPDKDLNQALFHLRLHAVATKYGCPALAEVAMKAMHVVYGRLNSIDSLTIWKEGYHLGSSIRDLDTGPLSRVKAKIKDLFRDHAQTMSEMVATTPTLATDLLELMAMES